MNPSLDLGIIVGDLGERNEKRIAEAVMEKMREISAQVGNSSG